MVPGKAAAAAAAKPPKPVKTDRRAVPVLRLALEYRKKRPDPYKHPHPTRDEEELYTAFFRLLGYTRNGLVAMEDLNPLMLAFPALEWVPQPERQQRKKWDRAVSMYDVIGRGLDKDACRTLAEEQEKEKVQRDKSVLHYLHTTLPKRVNQLMASAGEAETQTGTGTQVGEDLELILQAKGQLCADTQHYDSDTSNTNIMRVPHAHPEEKVLRDLDKRPIPPLGGRCLMRVAPQSPSYVGLKKLVFVNHSTLLGLIPSQHPWFTAHKQSPHRPEEAHGQGDQREKEREKRAHKSLLFSLPPELHSVIAPFLGFQDRLQVSLTCKGASDPRGCAYRAFERLRVGKAVCKACIGTDKVSLLACPPLCKRPITATRTLCLPPSLAPCPSPATAPSSVAPTCCTFALDSYPEALLRLLLCQTRQLTTLCVNEFVVLSQHLSLALRLGGLQGLERLELMSDCAGGLDAKVGIGAATCLAQALHEHGRRLERLSHLDCCEAALDSGAADLLAQALADNAWPSLTHLSLCLSHDDGRQCGEKKDKERGQQQQQQQQEEEGGGGVGGESAVQRLLTALTRRSCDATVPLRALRLMAEETEEKEGEDGEEEEDEDEMGEEEEAGASCRASEAMLRTLLLDSQCCAALEELQLDDVIHFHSAADLRVLVDYMHGARGRGLQSLSLMRDARHPICADLLTAALEGRALPALHSLTLSCDFFLTQAGADSLASWLRTGVDKSRLERLDLAWLTWEPREAAGCILEGLHGNLPLPAGREGEAPGEVWPSLKVLCVTEAGSVGVEAVARLVAEGRLPALEELVLGGAPVGEEELLALVDAARQHPMTGLRELDLWQSELSVGGMRALCAAMEAGAFPSLEDLEVGDNTALGEQGVRALIQAMSSGAMARLRSVRLRHVDMGKGGVRALAEALEGGHMRNACPRLRAIAVNEGEERLRQAIRGTDIQLES